MVLHSDARQGRQPLPQLLRQLLHPLPDAADAKLHTLLNRHTQAYFGSKGHFIALEALGRGLYAVLPAAAPAAASVVEHRGLKLGQCIAGWGSWVVRGWSWVVWGWSWPESKKPMQPCS